MSNTGGASAVHGSDAIAGVVNVILRRDFDGVRVDLLEPSPKTDSDRACPHGVQFYDVVIEGARHARVAWSYESPKPALQAV